MNALAQARSPSLDGVARLPFRGGNGAYSKSINGQDRFRIGTLLDSLFAGSSFGSPHPSMAAALRARYGDAGPGLIITQLGPMNIGAFGKTGGVQYAASLAWGDPIRAKTINGCGLYTTAASGSDGWTYTPNSTDFFGAADVTWDCLKLHFIHLSGGSSFRICQGNMPTASGLLCDDAKYPSGTIQTAFYARDPGYNQGFRVDAAVGSTLWCAMELFREGAVGATITNLATGGLKTKDFATGLDEAFQRAWWPRLGLDMVAFNGGMNDRITEPASDLARYDAAIIERIRASRGTDLLMIRPNDSADAATTHLKDYDRAKRAQPCHYGLGYMDCRDVLGTHSQALAAGYMDPGDPVHPTGLGLGLLGPAYIGRLNR